jgi:hypothetical protein
LRNVEIHEQTFTGYVWFALKILTPNRTYQFEPDIQGRFNPEIDHIFPKRLKDRSSDYERKVDILWNMQPTKGEINRVLKPIIIQRNFLQIRQRNRKGDLIKGSKYLSDYDFLFPLNSSKQVDFHDNIWQTPFDFIEFRRKEMIDFLKHRYSIILKYNEEKVN